MAARQGKQAEKPSRLKTLLEARWFFAPEPEPSPSFPSQEKFVEERLSRGGTREEALHAYERRHEKHNRQISKRKAFHDETSKTIRRVFYVLVGTCLFCVVTLAGSPDSQLLTPEAKVTLPVLNYDISFGAFLIVGPVVIIALTVYLHLFLAQHRRYEIAPQDQQPMLPNFGGWTPRLAVLIIFYWMVPITLAVFAWKAWPRPAGPILLLVAFGVAALLVLLQMRRCPQEWRAWALPSLVIAFAVFCGGVYLTTAERRLNLFKADLSEKDLRGINLSGAFLYEANLRAANLNEALLTGAFLSNANLRNAKLRDANLNNGNLSYANLRGADLSPGGGLYLASGTSAVDADLTGANLGEANLDSVSLINADLLQADLSGADLSGADLRGADLDETCGDEITKLPAGLELPMCE